MDAHIHGTYTILDRAKEIYNQKRNAEIDSHLTESKLFTTAAWNEAVQDFLSYVSDEKIVFNICYPYSWGANWERDWQSKLYADNKVVNFKGLHPIYFAHQDFLHSAFINALELTQSSFVAHSPQLLLNSVVDELEHYNQIQKDFYFTFLSEAKNLRKNHEIQVAYLPHLELSKLNLLQRTSDQHEVNKSNLEDYLVEKYVWEYNLGEIGLDPSYLEVEYESQIRLLNSQLEKMWLDVLAFLYQNHNSSPQHYQGSIRLNLHSNKNTQELFELLESNLRDTITKITASNSDEIVKHFKNISLDLEILWYFHAYNESAQNLQVLIDKFAGLLIWIEQFTSVIQTSDADEDKPRFNINLKLGIGQNKGQVAQRKAETSQQLQRVIHNAQDNSSLLDKFVVFEETDSPYLFKIFRDI